MNEEEIPGLPDEDLLNDLADDQAARTAELEAQKQNLETPNQDPQPAQAKAETPAPKSEEQEEEEGESNTVLDTAQTAAEFALAVPTGAVDFAVDAINLVPGVEIPKIRDFENNFASAIREISSFVVPSIGTAGAATAAGKAAHAKVAWQFGNRKLVKLFSNAGINVGTGAAVDYINSASQEGDNLAGVLKEMFPKTFHWISNDWATLDGDAPEVKRAKSIAEGAGFGVLSSLLEASGTFLRAVRGTEKKTRLVAGPDSSKALFDELERAKFDKNTPEDVFGDSIKSQEEALDEIGAFLLSKQRDLAEPVPIVGVHDAFTEAESGVRTADPGGVLGAAVDAARIKGNIDTSYGRLGSIITEAARKHGLEADNLTKRSVVNQIVKNIKAGGKYTAELPSGKKLSFEQIDEAGTELAEILIDPRMDTGMLKATLDEFKDMTAEAGKKLTQTGYNAVMKSIKQYLDDYVNMDSAKAAAYLVTSEAGQISDIAEGARYMEGTEAVGRAQEQILDRMEYLMVEKGVAANYWGTALNYLNTYKRFSNDPRLLAASGGNPLDDTDEALVRIVSRAKNAIESLRYMSAERPQFLVPLQMAYEFSDGNIDTMYKLQNFIHESLPNVRKAFLDFQPEIPNQIMQGVWSNIYNSVLSSTVTPTKAGVANVGGLVAKPITTMVGAMARGDYKTIRRASYQYAAMSDTFTKAMKHMAFVFGKASRDPNSVSYIVRDDIVTKNEETMQLLKASAEAYVKEGEHGPMMLFNIAETLQDLGNNPILRFGANAMTALDGFTRSVLASIEARGRIYDEVYSKGGPIPTEKMMKEAADKYYAEMFDKNGMITNSAVENASREIALNLDTDNVKALSNLVSRVPAMRAFIMFPRTSDNVIQMFDKYSPYSLFTKNYNKLAYGKLDDIAGDDLKKLAADMGIPEDEHMVTKLHQLKAEVLGRKAVGTAAVMSAGFLFMSDRLRGRGHYDKEVQRTRGKDWVPQTVQAPDGRWYDYSWMGPVADWISLTADIFDNADTLDEFSMEQLLRKTTFVLGGSLTNRSMFAGVEPMFDMFAAGNPGAWRRWAANFGSSLVPFSGARNQLGQLLAPGVYELEKELGDNIKNRNRWYGVLNPSAALPKSYDWLDRRQVGNNGFWSNINNAFNPMKVADGLSDERQFLIDVEYDSRPTFFKSTKGIEYTAEERSELFRLMSESDTLRNGLRFIMKRKPAKEFRRQVHEQRINNGNRIDQKLWNRVHADITAVMRAAQREAELHSDFQAVIAQRQFQTGINSVRQEQGKAPIFQLENR
jgi:hypothetical protein